jgi:hypothetical protein
MTPVATFEPCNVNVRIKVSALWTSMLFVFAALTIVAAAIGEWNYFIFGSAIEVVLLAAVVYYAWTWPRRGAS